MALQEEINTPRRSTKKNSECKQAIEKAGKSRSRRIIALLKAQNVRRDILGVEIPKEC